MYNGRDPPDDVAKVGDVVHVWRGRQQAAQRTGDGAHMAAQR
jgi:hypothetical protein